MIYVTVGGHRQGFDRLVKKMDELAPAIRTEMVIQRGVSTYVPVNVPFFDFVSFADGEEYIRKAELVVSHAGAGSIIIALKHGVPILIVPRRKKYGEHFTDHQTELCAVLREEGRRNVFVVEDLEQLQAAIEQARRAGRGQGTRNEGRDRIIDELRSFLEGAEGK